MSKQFKQIACLLAASVLASISSQATAAAFQSVSQNAKHLGTAYAGAASEATDASIGFYNSAGLTRICNEQIVASAVAVMPHVRLNATSATPDLTSRVNIAPGFARSRTFSIVPAVHYASPLCDEVLYFGFSITSPYSLKTKYKNDSVARYMGVRSDIRTYDLSPSLALRVAPWLSLGAGVDAIYTFARFDSRVGTGVAELDTPFESTVSRWTATGHAGALIEFTDCTRLGVQYRAGYRVKGKGQAIVQDERVHHPIHARFRMPGSTVASIYHDITDCWSVMADVQWTNWKKFNRVHATFDDASGFQISRDFNFRNSTRYALGTAYQFSDCWKWRIGVASDRSPVRDFTRTTSIPDTNRTWLALGGQYRIDKCLFLDFGYSHIFFKKGYINQGSPRVVNLIATETFQGRVRSRADLIGMQITWDLT